LLERRANLKLFDSESPKAVIKGGVIALQMHKGFTMDIQFKDISIKFLEGNP
jgi:hypothetical protein